MANLTAALLKNTGLNWPILISIAGRGMNAVMVPASLFFITRGLSATEQGFYYTFSSVFALQGFIELGFLSCIAHVASHHNRGDVSDKKLDHREIKLLVSYSTLYGFGVALVAFTLVGGLGWFFIRTGDGATDFAFLPWWAFVTVSCINVCAAPMMAILDGCNEVKFTATVRVIGMIANNVVICAVLFYGGGLFALAAGAASLGVVTMVALAIRFHHLFSGLFSQMRFAYHRWHNAILPFQGKIALTTVCNYFLGALFTPALFRLSGPEAAGRFGMSLQLMNSIGAISLVWTTTKTGIYGSLARAADKRPLMSLFYRTTVQGAIFALLGVAALLLLYLIAGDRFQVFSRTLPLSEMLLLGWPVIVIQFTVAAMSLFRAFGEEALLGATIVHTCLHVVLLIGLIHLIGPAGAVWAQVISYSFGLVLAVFIFQKFTLRKNLRTVGSTAH